MLVSSELATSVTAVTVDPVSTTTLLSISISPKLLSTFTRSTSYVACKRRITESIAEKVAYIFLLAKSLLHSSIVPELLYNINDAAFKKLIRDIPMDFGSAAGVFHDSLLILKFGL